MATLYGIRNCDSVRKARKWLEEKGIDYHFHDYRSDGVEADRLLLWMKELGWENLINRRGSTWRGLSEEARQSMGEPEALMTMLEQPSIIKRPVLDLGDRRVVGFDAAEYQRLFSRHTL